MIGMQIDLDGDNAWPDIDRTAIVEAVWERTAGLPAGMQSGKPAVGILVRLPDGDATPVFAETSLAMFLTIADALRARYGDPRT
jgi:hypothetical protein